MNELIMHIIANRGNMIISTIETFTPEAIIKIIIITIANNKVAPFIIIIEDNKYPNDLFLNSNIPDNKATGTTKPKSIA